MKDTRPRGINSWTWPAKYGWAILGVVVAVLLTLPAVWPLAQPGLPLTHDGRFHIGRITDLRAALATGEMFPRWAEPMVEGLGFPFFSFYPSLFHYFGLGLTLLGLSDAVAFKLATALLPLLSAAAMFLFARSLLQYSGVEGYPKFVSALAAALVYAYTPYQLVDIYLRGSLPEAYALAILPLLFYALARLVQRPGLDNALLVVPLLSALVFTHSVMAVLGFGLALGFLAFSLTVEHLSAAGQARRPAGARQLLTYFSLAVGLGLGVSSLFWLPSLAERPYLSFESFRLGHFDATSHLAEAWPPAQMSPVFDFADPFRAGLAQVIVLALGFIPPVLAAVRGLCGRRASRLELLSAFFALGVLAVFFLLSPAALGIWGHAPLFTDMQYPWRTLGILAFCFSSLTAVWLAWLAGRWRSLFAIAAVVLLAGYFTASIVSLPVALTPMPVETLGTTSGVARYGGWDLRTTLPTQSFSTDEAEALTSLESMIRQPGRLSFQVVTSRPATMVLHLLYFPGWRVAVDGREVSSFPVSERGLLGFAAPEGKHTVEARFDHTPLRAGVEATSLLSLLVFVALVLVATARRHAPAAAVVAAVALAGIFVLPRFGVSAASPSQFQSISLPPSSGIRLLGVAWQKPAEERLNLTFFWQAQRLLDDLDSFVVVLDEKDRVLASVISRKPLEGAYPTSNWQPGEIVADTVELDGVPTIDIPRLRLSTGFRPPDQADSAAPVSSFRFLASGEPASSSPASPSGKEIGGLVALDAHEPPTAVVAPGGDLDIDLQWRALDLIPGSFTTYLHLLDASGKMWAQIDTPPGQKSYPGMLWSIGERVRETTHLAIPREAPPGRYSLRLGGYRYPSLENLPVTGKEQAAGDTSAMLGNIFVVAPTTRPAAIRPQQELRASFGDRVELLGFDLSPHEMRPGESIVLTTYWRALTTLKTDYVVSSQLLDPTGAVRGQNDGQPADGSYPTSLWQQGEYIVDKRTLKLDPGSPGGDYRLSIALYQWPALDRLAVRTEGNPIRTAVDLATIRVGPPVP
ncbi:MAG: hypothetical protein HYX94_02990 [Chloroflexi bacterium]|nr:hypothetical protein [Chloroflexota bacterium]